MFLGLKGGGGGGWLATQSTSTGSTPQFGVFASTAIDKMNKLTTFCLHYRSVLTLPSNFKDRQFVQAWSSHVAVRI